MAGKLDTRQKMINMMYLVFIAMLALNIGKEVLATLGVLDNELEASTKQVEISSDSMYANIAANANNSLNYKIPAEQVLKLKKVANDFDIFIQDIKEKMLVDIDFNDLKEIINQEDAGEESEKFKLIKHKDSTSYVEQDGELKEKYMKLNKFKKNVVVKGTDSIMSDGEKWTLDKIQYQQMDKAEVLNFIFFDGEKLTIRGEEYVSKFKDFPIAVNNIVRDLVLMESDFKNATTALGSVVTESKEVVYEFGSVNEAASKRFKYSEKIIKEDGASQDYLEANFLDFPVVASLAKLTKVQSDIRFIENSVLTAINDALGGSNLNSFQTLLVSEKPTFYTSEFVNAKIVMGKKDAAFEPDSVAIYYKREGDNSPPKRLIGDDFAIKSGEVVLNKRITIQGTYDLTGFLYKRNDDTQVIESIPVNSKLVITKEPNSANVSVDNMNVFYRGLRNPTTYSIFGVNPNTIVPSSNDAQFSALNRDKGKWTVQPTNNTAKIMTITVSGILNGIRRNFRVEKPYRILDAPPGTGSIKGAGQTVKAGETASRETVINGKVAGEKPADFFYEYNVNVKSFDIKIGSNTSISIDGDRISASSSARRIVTSASSGTFVEILNIVAEKQDGNVRTPYKVTPFYIKIR